ncbi:MAG TPA: hypothetical protein VF285_04530 [Castellaniella sp.]|uniref:hypothetical protein n=1 Tax=Castellaniella sp. TaxID=1955812 RepID=UPI002F1525EA
MRQQLRDAAIRMRGYLHHCDGWMNHLLDQGESTILKLAESASTTAWSVSHLLIDEFAS